MPRRPNRSRKLAKQPAQKFGRLGLVGGETLLGQELTEALKRSSEKSEITTRLYAASGEGNFAEEDGEAVYREPLDQRALETQQAVLFAGNAEGAERAYQLIKARRHQHLPSPVLIDCTGVLDSMPEARICAPLLDEVSLSDAWLLVLAHPAAASLALVLSQMASQLSVQRTVADIFEPASERGKRGIHELQQQTLGLLSFKTLEKAVFDAQLSFNLLPAYGEEAPQQLENIEQRIETHLVTLLGRRVSKAVLPMPSIRLIQVPVFHGYSMSIWVEFAGEVSVEQVRAALVSAQIEVRSAGEEVPTNVEIAAQSGIQVGDIRVDRNRPRAIWIWLVVDNLRWIADSAEELLLALETTL
jgi:aspartate-semialdehyde dehydrogenase